VFATVGSEVPLDATAATSPSSIPRQVPAGPPVQQGQLIADIRAQNFAVESTDRLSTGPWVSRRSVRRFGAVNFSGQYTS